MIFIIIIISFKQRRSLFDKNISVNIIVAVCYILLLGMI